MSELKFGLIGAGTWGEQHAKVLTTLPDTRLVCICDGDGNRAKSLAQKNGAERHCSDYKELLAIAEIDAVCIATPDHTHTQIILDALASDKHVLTEKPLATTLAEAQAVVAACNQHKRQVVVDFHNRVNPVIAGAQEAIHSGTIGNIIHASARLSNTTYVPLQMLSWAGQSSALWFLGSHTIDSLRFLLDDEVTQVFARSRTGVLQAQGVDTEDVHLALLEFSKGALVSLENSWILSPDNPQIFDFRIELVGDAGQLSLNPSHNGALQQLGGGGLRFHDTYGVTPAGVGRVGGFVHEAIARFVDTLLHQAAPLASAWDGLQVTRVLTAIEQSVRSGAPVKLNSES